MNNLSDTDKRTSDLNAIIVEETRKKVEKKRLKAAAKNGGSSVIPPSGSGIPALTYGSVKPTAPVKSSSPPVKPSEGLFSGITSLFGSGKEDTLSGASDVVEFRPSDVVDFSAPTSIPMPVREKSRVTIEWNEKNNEHLALFKMYNNVDVISDIYRKQKFYTYETADQIKTITFQPNSKFFNFLLKHFIQSEALLSKIEDNVSN